MDNFLDKLEATAQALHGNIWATGSNISVHALTKVMRIFLEKN